MRLAIVAKQAASLALVETLAEIEAQMVACVSNKDFVGLAALTAKAEEAKRALELAEQVTAAALAAHEEKLAILWANKEFIAAQKL